ncbi:DUF4340 domain-containing protein [Pantanalinema sp. GBBB05]|uniref:DUF4340 domain-containing protein n=1 Tax=Pantanalinema sp. GBBB05 TaxID=2604139 RepID=UPI001E071894|nr:DUF4340 domain-containing protein [Pantanalinema sp. GBBB05]
MKLQRTPLILLAIAVLLGGVVYLLESQRTAQQEAIANNPGQRIFSFEESQVQSLSLTTPQQALTFDKVPAAQPKPSPSPTPTPTAITQPLPRVWMMTAPKKQLANEASIAFLVNLITTGKKQQSVTVPIARQAEFGLDKPLASIEVKLQNQQIHRLILGKPNFDRSGLYAQIDPPMTSTQNLTLAIVPIDFESAVTRPLSEWQSSQQSTKSTQPSPLPADQSSKNAQDSEETVNPREEANQ